MKSVVEYVGKGDVAMEMLQLRYFYESAKNENFTKTAQKYEVPTTSVSASIKRLEKELDVKLFDRNANKIALNSNGKMLFNTLSSVFEELDEVVEKLSVHKEDTREIKLLVCAMRRKITDLITEYSEKYSHVNFKTVFNHNEVDYRDYDIIVDEEKERYEDYERIELFNLKISLKCSAHNPLCNQKLTLGQLKDHPFVLTDSKANMNKVITRACAKVGFSPQISVLCNDIECHDKFVASGLGIGVGTQGDLDVVDGKKIVDLDVTDFDERYQIFAFFSKKEYYGKLKSFVDFLKSKSL